MPTTSLRLENVSKTFRIPHERRTTVKERIIHLFRPVEYEQLRALDGVNLLVQPGEFVGIVGRNGSGKSTLLKLISDIYPPTTGAIKVTGSISPFLELGVGFTPELSAHDNVYLYGSVLGIPRARLQERFHAIMRFAELEKFTDTKLKNFSSGMWVRLAFAVAIEVEADIYLFDEVLAVGDQAFQQKCFEIFHGFKQQKKTVVYISHSLDTVRKFCTRAVYLRNGRIEKDGAVEEVLEKYLNEVSEKM